jgi:quercetin dioxygenase-like cupin family protein
MTRTTTDYPAFIKNFPRALLPDGSSGPFLIGGDKGQVVFHTIASGQAVSLHSHNDSWAIIVSGSLEVTVGKEHFSAGTGMSWFIPEGVEHGGKAIDDSLLIEVFCEKRFSPA